MIINELCITWAFRLVTDAFHPRAYSGTCSRWCGNRSLWWPVRCLRCRYPWIWTPCPLHASLLFNVCSRHILLTATNRQTETLFTLKSWVWLLRSSKKGSLFPVSGKLWLEGVFTHLILSWISFIWLFFVCQLLLLCYVIVNVSVHYEWADLWFLTLWWVFE